MSTTTNNGWWSYLEHIDTDEELNPLATIFRKICLEMGIITGVQYEDLLQSYVERTVVDPKKRNATKSNLKKAMLSPSMTINTFNECILMLDADGVKIGVTLTKDEDTFEVTDSRRLRRSKVKSAVLRKRIIKTK